MRVVFAVSNAGLVCTVAHLQSNGQFTVMDHELSVVPNQVVQNFDAVEPNAAPFSLVFEVMISSCGVNVVCVSRRSMY